MSDKECVFSVHIHWFAHQHILVHDRLSKEMSSVSTMSIEDLRELFSEKSGLVISLTTIFCLVIASFIFLSKKKIQSLEEQEAEKKELRKQSRAIRSDNPFSESTPSNNSTSDLSSNKQAIDPNDVWKDRRRKGVVPAKSSTKEKAPTGDKPFHSSYYYAHNSTNSKGGYSDGLQMEDFTMNGPRLLSKGGKSVQTSNEEQTMSTPFIEELPEDDDENQSNPPKATHVSSQSQPQNPTLVISKYLWDDPGDSKGVASIRIDSLPNPKGTGTIDWKDVSIQSTEAKLINDKKGLLVTAKATDVIYKLEIKQLYGEVSSVKTIVKAKRLIVKLQKNTGYFYRKNLEEWPHPQKKTI